MTVYSVACRLLDLNTTRCSDYANRLEKMPTCHALTPNNVPQYTWLPKTCAYRRVHLGKPLPEWHPLLTGNRNEMRKRGEKVGTFALSRNDVNKRQMDRPVPLGKAPPECHPHPTGHRNEMRKRGEKVGPFALSRNDVNKRQMERHVLKERQLKK